ncbi:hypothetical protein Ccrd_006187, partial [Cynara cardunculus var. scolymus]
FLENLEKVLKKKDFPVLDIFICTADPYKELAINVVNTSLFLMAYDYPPEKRSRCMFPTVVALSLLSLLSWRLPSLQQFGCCFVGIITSWIDAQRPYFNQMKLHFLTVPRSKVQVSVVMTNALIVLTQDRNMYSNDTKTPEWVLCFYADYSIRYIYDNYENDYSIHYILAHEVAGSNYENDLVWGSKIGFSYGSLSENSFTGLHQHSKGWKSLFFHPRRPVFLGDLLISLYDALNQNRRWCIGFLEVVFQNTTLLTFGSRFMGPLVGLAYAHNALLPIWSISIIIGHCTTSSSQTSRVCGFLCTLFSFLRPTCKIVLISCWLMGCSNNGGQSIDVAHTRSLIIPFRIHRILDQTPWDCIERVPRR